MEYSDIQIIENKIVKIVYDTLNLTDRGPKGIPQSILQDHNKKGYTRANPGLIKLYKSRLDKLIIEYVKSVILYVFHNDITDLTHVCNGYPQKFIEIEQNTEDDYKHRFSSWHYWREEKVPLVYVDFEKNLIDIPWVGNSSVGARFEYDFIRKADIVLGHIYDELKDNNELMCWLMLAGVGQLFSREVSHEQ